jgi:hypothetical protein
MLSGTHNLIDTHLMLIHSHTEIWTHFTRTCQSSQSHPQSSHTHLNMHPLGCTLRSTHLTLAHSRPCSSRTRCYTPRALSAPLTSCLYTLTHDYQRSLWRTLSSMLISDACAQLHSARTLSTTHFTLTHSHTRSHIRCTEPCDIVCNAPVSCQSLAPTCAVETCCLMR